MFLFYRFLDPRVRFRLVPWAYISKLHLAGVPCGRDICVCNMNESGASMFILFYFLDTFLRFIKYNSILCP